MSQHSLNQLKRYDAEAIGRYYDRRPWVPFLRVLKILWLSFGFLLGFLWDRLRAGSDRSARQKTNPKRARQALRVLTDLGPTFIKVGQALSTRPDLVRRDYLEELVKLQDEVAPFDNSVAFATIERELDRAPAEIYSELSPQPVAAASLGQVYRGRLHSGEEVAVKVQRPHLIPIVTLDLYLLRKCANAIAPLLPLNLGCDLASIVDEFGSKLFEEIDYANEGENAERFANNFQDDPTVKVPKIYWRHTTSRVLTLEWIDGIKLNSLAALRKQGIDTDKLMKVGVSAGLQQLLEHGFFHADPHPGNLFAMQDGRMAFIDFGMMDQLRYEDKETLVDAIVCLVNKDYEELAEAFVKLGFLEPGTDISPIVPALEMVLGDIIGKSVGNFNIKTVTDRFSDLMYEYPFRVPSRFALIIRSVVTQEGLALSLDPNFKIVEIGYPYVARRLLAGETPELRRRLVEVLFKDGKFQWARLENLIAIARTDESFDLLPTAQLGIQYLMSSEGEFLRQRLMLALVDEDRLHAEEVKRLWDLVKDDLKPDRLVRAALGTLSAFPLPKAAFQ